jgi:2-dehydropantoate 2-reductase
MKIVVVGTGGVGGYFGGRLANAGHDVTFIARGEHLKAIHEKGLTVKSIKGDFTLDKVKVTDNLNNVGKADLIILALKAWQIKPLIGDISNLLKNDTIILPLQNGITIADELSEVIPYRHIVGGTCRIISMIESPGVIRHSGVDPVIFFGELDKSETSRLQMLKEIFIKAGIDARATNKIDVELWKKFILICVSGLLAVSRTTYGQIREIKETRQLMTDLFNEVYNLSCAAGVEIEDNYVDKVVAAIDTYAYDSTSSLTRDVLDGKPSEIEYQNGAVVRLAEKLGVDVPVNRFVYSCILPMEIEARKKL